MAIDMKTVKEIEFNNKQVKKIEDNNGNILWQKKSATTVTITLTNLKYIDLNYVYIYYDSPFSYTRTIVYGHMNYINITGVLDNRDTDAFAILPMSTYTNIKNKTYTEDTTITGNNYVPTDSNYYVICYISNNELYSVGNINNTTVDGAVGTTSELSNVVAYKNYSASLTPSYESAGTLLGTNNLYISIPNSSSDGRRVNNVSNPINPKSARGATNGGVQPSYRDSSGTMTLQYTI